MRRSLAATLILSFLCASCGGHRAPSDEKAVRAFVSILPLAWFVERVGGKRIQVEVLVRPGASPQSYMPTAKQMVELGHARVFFRIGVPFEEGFLPKLASVNPDLMVEDLRRGIEMLPMKEDHGHAGDVHGNEGLDPHVWLDPVRAVTIARNVCSALVKIDPGHRSEYETNLEAVEKDLGVLHGKIERILEPVRGKDLFVYHPAFGYFADRYGLRQTAVETGGKEPGPRALAALIDRAREAGAGVIFVQSQFSRKSAEAVGKTVGSAVVPIDPLARDYLANLEGMALAIERGLK